MITAAETKGRPAMTQIVEEVVSVGDRSLRFQLHRKKTRLGSIDVDHWWMPVPPLYGQRQRNAAPAVNHKAVIEAFWALCRQEGSFEEADIRNVYLLARLLPQMRSLGSRRIVADAHLDPASGTRWKRRRDAVAELEELLHSGRGKSVTWSEFRAASKIVLGPPPLTQETKDLYVKFAAELLTADCQQIEGAPEAALAEVIDRWQSWMTRIGRRRGGTERKFVLDILSYEARAAFHQCYSATWHMVLLPHLAEKYVLDPCSQAFLGLWHLEQVRPAPPDSPMHDHLFHGHIFGLHPATAQFLTTTTGPALVGNWLEQNRSEETFERLLGGVLLALYHYSGRRQQIEFERGSSPILMAPQSLTDADAEQQTRRRSQRRKKKRLE
jgi:hypothetical protein